MSAFPFHKFRLKEKMNQERVEWEQDLSFGVLTPSALGPATYRWLRIPQGKEFMTQKTNLATSLSFSKK